MNLSVGYPDSYLPAQEWVVMFLSTNNKGSMLVTLLPEKAWQKFIGVMSSTSRTWTWFLFQNLETNLLFLILFCTFLNSVLSLVLLYSFFSLARATAGHWRIIEAAVVELVAIVISTQLRMAAAEDVEYLAQVPHDNVALVLRREQLLLVKRRVSLSLHTRLVLAKGLRASRRKNARTGGRQEAVHLVRTAASCMFQRTKELKDAKFVGATRVFKVSSKQVFLFQLICQCSIWPVARKHTHCQQHSERYIHTCKYSFNNILYLVFRSDMTLTLWSSILLETLFVNFLGFESYVIFFEFLWPCYAHFFLGALLYCLKTCFSLFFILFYFFYLYSFSLCVFYYKNIWPLLLRIQSDGGPLPGTQAQWHCTSTSFHS